MADQTAHKSISIQALDRLIAAHDGNVALLWLYWQRSGSLDAEKAAAALCLTLQEVLAAEEKLRRMALPEPLPAPAGTPAPGKPVGDTVEFGGLLGSAPVIPVHPFSSAPFIARGGRIPAPMQSLKN